jgi:hypothetical protein
VPDWIDRGVKSANFGELRELDVMAGCLTEVAFHDNAYDASFLKRPPFRKTVARSVAKAALDYFGVNVPLFPMPVRNMRIIPPQPGVLRLMWNPTADPSFPGAIPTNYRIYATRGLDGMDNGVVTTTETFWDVEEWTPGEVLTFRVAAVNSGGESLLSEPVVARVWPNQFPQVLIVNGFDRLDRSVQEEDNTGDFALDHARALVDAGQYSFVSVSNEAVAAQLIDLPLFQMVDWISGEEARLPEEIAAFTALNTDERSVLSEYWAGGGHLMISGSEIGWDVYENGFSNDAYKTFYTDVLKALYVEDDAETYSFVAVEDDWFDGINGTFDNGANGSYDVDWPDVLDAANGGRVCLTYPDHRGMAVCDDQGPGKLLYMAVPFEAFVGQEFRGEFMSRIASHMLSGSADGDVDGDIDGDWDLDLDREAPLDGDIEYVELDFGISDPIDGDQPHLDGDFSVDGDEIADGDQAPADGDLSVDGDAECLPGYTQDGGMCVKREESGEGGCAQKRPESGGWLVLVLVSLFIRTRRRSHAQ